MRGAIVFVGIFGLADNLDLGGRAAGLGDAVGLTIIAAGVGDSTDPRGASDEKDGCWTGF